LSPNRSRDRRRHDPAQRAGQLSRIRDWAARLVWNLGLLVERGRGVLAVNALADLVRIHTTRDHVTFRVYFHYR
jgi:hypothetical protein